MQYVCSTVHNSSCTSFGGATRTRIWKGEPGGGGGEDFEVEESTITLENKQVLYKQGSPNLNSFTSSFNTNVYKFTFCNCSNYRTWKVYKGLLMTPLLDGITQCEYINGSHVVYYPPLRWWHRTCCATVTLFLL